MRHSLTLILPALLFLTSCATRYGAIGNNARERELGNQGYISLPLNSYSGDTRYWSSVKVAGSEVKLLLDSGANSTDIDKNSADSIGLKQNTDFEVVSRGALGREVKSKLGITTFNYGTQSISPFVIVINESGRKGSSMGRYNGQIGLDALVESATLIDLSNQKIWMPRRDIPGDNYFPRLGGNQQLGRESLPLYTANKYGHLILTGTVGGKKSSWIVDTGAEVSVIDNASAKRLGMKIIPTNSRMIDISGDSSRLGFTIASNLRFGNTTFPQAPFAAADLGGVKRSFKLPDGRYIDGILGVDFLKVSKALIDPRSKLIHLGYAESRNTP